MLIHRPLSYSCLRGEYRLDDDASSSSPNNDTATSSPFLPLMQTWSYGACTQPLSGVVHVNITPFTHK